MSASPAGYPFRAMLPPGTRFSKVNYHASRVRRDGSRRPLLQGNQFHGPKLDQAFQEAPSASVERRVKGCAMTILKWALIFFLISIVSGILGFTGISAASADVARFLFYVFVVIFLVLLILGLTIFRV